MNPQQPQAPVPLLDPARRSMALWVGRGTSIDPAALAGTAASAIAKPLVHAAANARQIRQARAAGLGVVLPGEAWRNQLPVGHQKRSAAFANLPFAQDGRLRPEAGPFPAAFRDSYAAAYVEAQLTAGATLVTTPGHVADPADPVFGHTRVNDLALAEAAADEFAARAGQLAPDGTPRALMATVAVQAAHLAHPGAASALAAAYADLDVAGYWLVLVNAQSPSGRLLAAVTEIALELQDRTGRGVCASCVGAPHLALLSAGVAATCFGHFGGSLTYPPPEWDRDADEGIGIAVYHREILGSIKVGQPGAEQRASLFAAHPCACGAHEPHEPPAGAAAREHNLRCLLAEAHEATSGAPAQTFAWLQLRIARARTIRADLELSNLNAPAWSAPGRIAREREERRAAG